MSPLSYFDEDLTKKVRARTFRDAGYDVLTAFEAGMLSRSDPEHLELATTQGRLLLSHNIKDFQQIHGQWMLAGRHHGGILLVRQTANFGPSELLRRFELVAETFRDIGTRDQLLFLSNFG